MAIVDRSNAESVRTVHPAESCAQTAEQGPRGGWHYPRTEQYRRNGRTQTWKREPARFSIPVKYGLRDAFRLTESDCYGDRFHDGTAEDCELGTLRASLRAAHPDWYRDNA